MTGLFGTTKRLLVGRPMQSEHLGHTLLPKKIALPVFASDALSSVAYATEEILLVLSVGGLALLHYTPARAGHRADYTPASAATTPRRLRPVGG